jgi:hypothetical protein
MGFQRRQRRRLERGQRQQEQSFSFPISLETGAAFLFRRSDAPEMGDSGEKFQSRKCFINHTFVLVNIWKQLEIRKIVN